MGEASYREKFDIIIIGMGVIGFEAIKETAKLGLNIGCVEAAAGTTPVLSDAAAAHIVQKLLYHAALLRKQVMDPLYLHNFVREDLPSWQKNFALQYENLKNNVLRYRSAFLRDSEISLAAGEAHFVNPHMIAVNGRYWEASHFIVATGSYVKPWAPSIHFGNNVLTAEGLLNRLSRNPQLPPKMTVLGNSSEAVETALLWRHLGAEVLLISSQKRVPQNWNPSLQDFIAAQLTQAGVMFLRDQKIMRVVRPYQDRISIVTSQNLSQGGLETEYKTDDLIVVDDKVPFLETLQLQNAGLTCKEGQVFLQENWEEQTHIHLCGNVEDPSAGFFHHLFRLQAILRRIGGQPPVRTDARFAASVLNGFPSVASWGYREEEIRETPLRADEAINSVKIDVDQSLRSPEESHRSVFLDPVSRRGFVKVHAATPSGKILGIHAAGINAKDFIFSTVPLAAAFATVENILTLPPVEDGLYGAFREACRRLQILIKKK